MSMPDIFGRCLHGLTQRTARCPDAAIERRFEVKYEFTLFEMDAVLAWIGDPERKWRGRQPIPPWVREMENLGREAAYEKVRVRALAYAAADAILTMVRPDLDEPSSMLPPDLAPL
jgi:hypothetical protein